MLWLCKQICTASLRLAAQGQGIGCCICLELVSRCCWRPKGRFKDKFSSWVTQVWITESMVFNNEDKHQRENNNDTDTGGEQGVVCQVQKSVKKTTYILQLLPAVRREWEKLSPLWTRTDAAAYCLLMPLTMCVRESLQLHYHSIDFSTPPTEQDTVSNRTPCRTAGDNSKAHCSLQFYLKKSSFFFFNFLYFLCTKRYILKLMSLTDIRVRNKHKISCLSKILTHSCWNNSEKHLWQILYLIRNHYIILPIESHLIY